jgi:hypothetical protein
VRSRKKLPWTSLSNSSRHRGPHLVAWAPRHVFNHVSGGPDSEVVVHDNGTLDSDAAGAVDIILVDETHSSVVHHPIPGTTPIPLCTPPIGLLAHHHKRPSKWRSRASHLSLVPQQHGELDAHRLHLLPHTVPSVLSFPLSRSCSPSSVSPFQNVDRPALGVRWPQPQLCLRSRLNDT